MPMKLNDSTVTESFVKKCKIKQTYNFSVDHAGLLCCGDSRTQGPQWGQTYRDGKQNTCESILYLYRCDWICLMYCAIIFICKLKFFYEFMVQPYAHLLAHQ